MEVKGDFKVASTAAQSQDPQYLGAKKSRRGKWSENREPRERGGGRQFEQINGKKN